MMHKRAIEIIEGMIEKLRNEKKVAIEDISTQRWLEGLELQVLTLLTAINALEADQAYVPRNAHAWKKNPVTGKYEKYKMEDKKHEA